MREAGFENSLSALEGIIKQLELGDLPLERALELFEEGVRLARHCQDQLTEVEQRVELLLRERGEIKAVPFDMGKTEKNAEPIPHRQDMADTSERSEDDEVNQDAPF